MSFEIKVRCNECGCEEYVSYFNVEKDPVDGTTHLVCPTCHSGDQVSSNDVKILKKVVKK